VEKHDLCFGEMLFCKGLSKTEEVYGTSREMSEFKNAFVRVDSFADGNAIHAKTNAGEQYTIHMNDLVSPSDLGKEGDVLIVKINDKRELHFDESQLVI